MTEPEITTESKERLEVLELDRTPRPEKLSRETALLDGASEVHFAERAFKPRHPATLDEIRAAVDSLSPRLKRALPEPAPLPPPPPAPVPAPRIRDEHRAAFVSALAEGDELMAVESVYKTDAGEVVDATIAHHGKTHVGTFLIEGGRAKKMADVHHAVDALPRPKSPAPAPASARPATEKRSKFAMPKLGKKEKAAMPAEADPDPKTNEKPSKFKLPFGKKK